MKRIRWLNAEWQLSLKTLVARMKQNTFTLESYDGFIIDRIRDTFVEARYIEKLSYQEYVKDPFGNEEVFDRTIYRQIAFNVLNKYPNIELIDAPRSTNAYVSRLLELSNFSLSINTIQVNLFDWVNRFQSQIQKDVIIDSIHIVGLELEQGINAKILIQGDKDVRKALNKFIFNKKYVLEKIQFKIPNARRPLSINLSNNGSAKVPEDAFEDLLPLLRLSLPESKLS
jgi:hypothetical protein